MMGAKPRLWKSAMVFWTILILFMANVILVLGNDETDINAIAGDFEAAFQGKCGPSSPCVQLCAELHDGTFECQCRPGFRLLLDGYSCVVLTNSTYPDDEDSDELESDLEYNSNLDQSKLNLARLSAAKAAAVAAAKITQNQNQHDSNTNTNTNTEDSFELEGRPLPRPMASSSHLQRRTFKGPSKEAAASAAAASAAVKAAEAKERSNYLRKFAPIDSPGENLDFFGLNKLDSDPTTRARIATSKPAFALRPKVGNKRSGGDGGLNPSPTGEDYESIEDEDSEGDEDDDEDSTNEAEEDLASMEGALATKSTNVREPSGGGEEDDDDEDDFILPPRALPLRELNPRPIQSTPATLAHSLSPPSSSAVTSNKDPVDQQKLNLDAPAAPSSISSSRDADPSPISNGEVDCPVKCNRGVCTKEVLDEMGFRCLCPMGTRGTFCEIEEIFEEGGGYNSGLFRGKSWIAFPVLHDAYMADTISIEFRPQSPDGIILLTGERDDLSGDYLALFLKDGYLEFRFDCGSGSGVVRSSGPVKLEQWNKASIVRRRWDGWMQLNDGPFTQGRSKGLFSRITFRQPVYIGGQGNITFNSVSSIQSNFDDEPELVSSTNSDINTYTYTTSAPSSSSFANKNNDISGSIPSESPSSNPSTNSNSRSSPDQFKSMEDAVLKMGLESLSVKNEKNLKNLKNDVDSEEASSTVAVLKRIGGFQGCIRNLVINDRVYRFGLEPAGDSLQGFDIENCNDQGVCDLVKCQHGGQCLVQKDENPTCLCPLGFSGQLCETPLDLQIPSFNGSSYLKYGGLGQTRVLSWLELEIVIKPDAMDGLVMYNGYKTDGMGDFISLVIDQGYIEFAMDLGTGTAIIRSDSPVVLGEWHHIHVSRTSRLISLRIDNQPPLMALTPGAFTQLSLPHNLFLGGIPDPQWLSPKVKVQGGFSGCIQKLVINEKPLRIMGSAMSGVNLENCEHPCLRNPCDHGGDCIPQLDTFKCHCPLGFRDPYCQTRMDKQDVITAPRFIGDSYLRFTHPRIIKRLSGWRLNLSFRLKTDSSHGLLVWAGRKWMTSASDFISMGLRNGLVTASFSLGSGQTTIAYNFTTVNDGRWHHIILIRNEQEASLSVDDGPPVTGVAPGKLRQLNINDGLYIGGLEEARHQSMNRYTEGFIGCLTDLVLGSERVSLLQEASEGRNVDYCD